MTPDADSSPRSLATASGLLLGGLGVSMAIGALVGWAFGAPASSGSCSARSTGIPLGVFAVYYVYTRAEPPARASQAPPLHSQNGTGPSGRAREAARTRPDNDEDDSW